MSPFLTRCFRGGVLAMMVLLSGMASMICYSYDADGDESTPPVTIEFNGVVPSKKSVQIPKPQSTAAAHHVRDEQPAAVEALVAEDFSSSPLLEKDPPQLLVPLRL
ncbi:MAG TPA: hypothetical protein VGQ61_17605 [Candidatus Angelobacter sp.]|jgi:hypothetical protein|nr:hypothetical protein [Candidatus Angelobacter sp.]